MKYYIKENEIIIPNNNQFNAKHILECGQVFRFKTTSYGYDIYTLHHKASIYCQKDSTIIKCNDVNYFINYFDLNTNYDTIKLQLSSDSMLKDAVEFGWGIRILKQNALETIISFIISANNNIPRIKKIIESICEGYGTNMGDYFAFPTIEQLKTIPKEFFTSIKSGYRDTYLYNTIQAIANGFNVDIVNEMPTEIAAKHLQLLSGVGPKVADCVLLFGFYKTDIFPTDTWIKKVYYDYNKQINPQQNVTVDVIRKYFVSKYGNNSGYAQQYLFYFKREVNEK